MLFLVATPIGNLSDFSLRGIETLKQADIVAAEDTRHSIILLRHYGIEKPMVSYHQHNEARRTEELIQRLEEGQNVAVITDAGMPGISDPGHRLLRACIARGIPYTVIPGASAVVNALIGSGFPAEQFFFGGFLPVKSGQRERQVLDALEKAGQGITCLYFESPYRLTKTLAVFQEKAPEQLLCVARELTKQFEEFRIGKPAEVLAHYEAHPPKGEICLVVRGQD